MLAANDSIVSLLFSKEAMWYIWRNEKPLDTYVVKVLSMINKLDVRCFVWGDEDDQCKLSHEDSKDERYKLWQSVCTYIAVIEILDLQDRGADEVSKNGARIVLGIQSWLEVEANILTMQKIATEVRG